MTDTGTIGPLDTPPHPRAIVPLPRLAWIVKVKADTCRRLADTSRDPHCPEAENWRGLADELDDVVWMLRALQTVKQ